MRYIMVCFAVFCLLGEALASNAPDSTFTNSIGMEFVLIPAGTFIMGTGPSFKFYYKNETPAHRVGITKAFYLGKYEVTQDEWDQVMGKNPSEFKGRRNPVENVSWNDAQNFVSRLNQMEGREAYRLPTEAEWEYAARAGTKSAYSFGDDEDSLKEYEWYADNSDDKTHPAGQKMPNPWGLHDMHGNVMEWTADLYGKYSSSPSSDPKGPDTGSRRVIRGGSWNYGAADCRAAARDFGDPGDRRAFLGFRLALAPE